MLVKLGPAAFAAIPLPIILFSSTLVYLFEVALLCSLWEAVLPPVRIAPFHSCERLTRKWRNLKHLRQKPWWFLMSANLLLNSPCSDYPLTSAIHEAELEGPSRRLSGLCHGELHVAPWGAPAVSHEESSEAFRSATFLCPSASYMHFIPPQSPWRRTWGAWFDELGQWEYFSNQK